MTALVRPIPIWIIVALAAAATLAGLAVATVRISSAVSFTEAIQTITSGWEQQTLFDLWRFINDESLYLDRTRLPFHTAFYNWLFYYAYGPVVQFGLTVFGLDVSWLPTLARGFNLIGALAGMATITMILRRMISFQAPGSFSLSLAYAITLFTGPLVGFWIFTARADVWSMTLEMMAVLVFWRLDRARPWLALIGAAVLAYAAWSVKHGSVLAAGTLALYLLTRSDWRRLSVFVGLMAGGFGLTFLLAPPNYFPSLLGVVLDPIPARGIRNLENFAVKSLPFLLPIAAQIAAFAFSPSLRRVLVAGEALRLVAIGSVISLGIGFLGGFKEGAGENYYFTASCFLALAAALGWRRVEDQPESPWTGVVRLAMATGWALHGLAIAGILAGFWGVMSVRPIHHRNEDGRACIEKLPKPVFAQEQYLSLPWINPSRPVIFPSYNYFAERARGVPYQDGGIGALIEKGYFGALILEAPGESFDGGKLALYYRPDADACRDRTVYRRRSAPMN